MQRTRILLTPVGKKLYDALGDPRIKIILMPGGTRSGKTYAIMQCIHLMMIMQPQLRATAWRAKQTWIKLSILNDWERKFLGACDLRGLYKATKTPLMYTMKATGSTLEFSGLDDPQKAHGVASDIHWINEAIEAEELTFRQLLQRCEGKIIMDYNPSEEEHWVYNLARRNDCVTLHSTYLDNPFLPDTVIKEIEAYEDTPANRQQGTVSKYHWQVYGLGKAARREGLIFPQYEVIKEFPAHARFLGYGLDFGFYPDPVAFGRVALADGKLVLDECIYENGLNNIVIPGKEHIPSIEGRFRELGISRSEFIVADSAAKTSISELCHVGYNVHPVQKYAGSVKDGISLMQKYMPFQVTERSANTIRELKNYTWTRNPHTGLFLNEPIDKFNHLIDLYRYVVQTKISSPRINKPKVSVTRY